METNPNIQIIDLNFQGIDHAIACFLVQKNDNHLLIETGPHSSIEALEVGLKGCDIGLKDLSQALLTHIHLDHAGAAWALAENGTNIYLHPAGKSHLHNPEKLMNSARRIYKDKMDELWGAMKDIQESQLIEVNDYQTLSFGDIRIKALHTPGHAIHHISWVYEDCIFTGDVGGVKIANNRVVPPCPPPDINIEDWVESIEKIKNEKPEWLYLTHFGVVDQIDTHFEELEEILWDWANWMKPKYESQAKPEEVVEEFQNYVAGQLRNRGATEKEILQYETANPSWMSVSGLLRYWRKKLEN
ncbi:MAG: MBL fold metallo-hydrolase [Bacteroidota bacterium]